MKEYMAAYGRMSRQSSVSSLYVTCVLASTINELGEYK